MARSAARSPCTAGRTRSRSTARPAATSRPARSRSANWTQTGSTTPSSSSAPSTTSARRSTGPTSTASTSRTSRRAGCRSWRRHRPEPAGARHRKVRLARLAAAQPAPAHDRAALRHPHQLEQQAGARAGERPPTTGATAPVHRVQLYRGFTKGMHLNNDVSIMNRAATEDLRVIKVWPIIRRVLNGGHAPSKLAAQAADLIDRWRAGLEPDRHQRRREDRRSRRSGDGYRVGRDRDGGDAAGARTTDRRISSSCFRSARRPTSAPGGSGTCQRTCARSSG